jgi:hypothetical protein
VNKISPIKLYTINPYLQYGLSRLKGVSLSVDRTSYVTLSIPKGIGDEIDRLIKKLGYWPSRSAFAREACLEKIYLEKQRLGGSIPGD